MSTRLYQDPITSILVLDGEEFGLLSNSDIFLACIGGRDHLEPFTVFYTVRYSSPLVVAVTPIATDVVKNTNCLAQHSCFSLA